MNKKSALEHAGQIYDMVAVNGCYIVERRTYQARRRAQKGQHWRYDLRQCHDRRKAGHIEIYV